MKLPETKSARWGVIAGLAAVAAAFYALNVLTCLYADDYSYTYTFAVTEGKYRISNLYELYLSQRNHYLVMNGRTVVHTLAQLFLMWGKPIFNVLNTIAFVGLGCLIYRSGSPKSGELRPAQLFFVFGLLWVVTPAFGESFLWLVGSCNYLFGILFILLSLLPVTAALDDGFAPMSGWKTPLYFLLCILAGWTNENNSVALVVIFLCCIFWLLVTKQKIPAWLWAGLAGSVIGCLLLLLSPGEATRLANSGGFGGLGVWLRRFVSITGRLLVYLGLELGLIALFFLKGLFSKHPVKALLKSGIFFLAGLASTYSMILSPQFPTRTWSGPVIFFAIVLVSLWRWVEPEPDRTHRGLTIAVSVLAILAVAATYVRAAQDLNETRHAVQLREAHIAEELSAGHRDVTLSPIHGETKWNCYQKYDDLNDDPTQWPNTAYAMYYGLDSVSKTK